MKIPLPSRLRALIDSGYHRIGQIEILSRPDGGFFLCHADDLPWKDDHAGLESHTGPEAARGISLFAEDGTYRFTKGQINLRRGWVLRLADETELLQALDLFYPACVGLFLAQLDGKLGVENLRDKLNRQTGMYRFARSISDAGAQNLVREVCGPAHNCAKKILWRIDPDTPLEDSEASRFNGIPGEIPESEAIPLVCREACNHFVAECRKVAKAEFDAKPAPAAG